MINPVTLRTRAVTLMMGWPTQDWADGVNHDVRKPSAGAVAGGLGFRGLGWVGEFWVALAVGLPGASGWGAVGGGVEGLEDGEGVGVGVGWLVAAAVLGG